MEEIWDLLDENGEKTNKTMKKGEQIPKGFYHTGADVWFINSENKILIIKRYKIGEVWLDVYVARQDIKLENIVMKEDEVSDVKWATYEEIEKLFQKGQFMPNRWEYVREAIKDFII